MVLVLLTSEIYLVKHSLPKAFVGFLEIGKIEFSENLG